MSNTTYIEQKQLIVKFANYQTISFLASNNILEEANKNAKQFNFGGGLFVYENKEIYGNLSK